MEAGRANDGIAAFTEVGELFIVYLICDETVVPQGSEHLLVENPLRVDDCVFCFAPDDLEWPTIEPEITAA